MKFLLLGKGKSIKAIKKYIKHNKDKYIQAVYEYQYNFLYKKADEKLLNLNDIDYAIKAPGIKETDKLYLKLKQKFIFINELDLLSIYNVKTKAIVVTGSNGKTSFVSMLSFLFSKARIRHIKCGNSFKPITLYYKKFDKIDYLIIEQSSFQLHNLSLYKPYISILLNLSENHLDDSYSLTTYYENKKNIYKYQTSKEYFILDSSNFKNKQLDTDATIIDLLKYPYIDLIDKKFNRYLNNLNYFYTIFRLLNINTSLIPLINDFKILKYRNNLTYKNGITFINDSKSTSVASTIYASNFINVKNTILIIGGKDKKISYKTLNDIGYKHIICYGQLSNIIEKQISKVILTNTLKQAFNIATSIKLDNKIILFSPATSSFDQYKNYIERGKQFDRLVKKYEAS